MTVGWSRVHSFVFCEVPEEPGGRATIGRQRVRLCDVVEGRDSVEVNIERLRLLYLPH